MKLQLAILVLILSSLNSFAQKSKLSSVNIQWHDFATETFVDIDCDSFRQVFKETIKTNSFTDSAHIVKLGMSLRYFRKEKKSKSIDVRGTISFCYDKTKVEYCFDKFGLFYRNGIYYNNPILFDFISKNLKQ